LSELKAASTSGKSAAAKATGGDGEPITCPYCGDSVSRLNPIESGMKLRLQENAEISPVPSSVCDGCFDIMSKMVAKGATLRMEAKAKENNRLMLWKSRVGLVKQAKQHLASKSYSDAAVSFEKYLRVLEIIYDKKSGELTPELFKNEKKAQELTVIASVYWDLLRVYDSHPSYADRQMKAALKLAEFIRFTPIYPHIMRKADSQTRTAKNPEAFKRFLKLSNKTRPRCFIATSAYQGYSSTTVQALCLFRDQRLKQTPAGRRFVRLYYRFSPQAACFLDRHPALKPTVRWLLSAVALFIVRRKYVRNCLKP
jgi:hypothetical protein